MGYIDPHGLIWTSWGHMGPYGVIWGHVRPIWSHMETIWAHMGAYGAISTHMGPDGAHMDTSLGLAVGVTTKSLLTIRVFGWKIHQNEEKITKMNPNVPKWTKMYPNGRKWSDDEKTTTTTTMRILSDPGPMSSVPGDKITGEGIPSRR